MQGVLKIIWGLNFLFCSIGLISQEGRLDTLSLAGQLFKEAEVLKSEKKVKEAFEKFDEASLAFLEVNDVSSFERCNKEMHSLVQNAPNEELIVFYEKKIEFCKTNFGEDNDQTALWYLFLGTIQTRMRTFESAKQAIETSLKIFLENDNRNREVIACYRQLGTISAQTGKFEEAENSFKNVIARSEELLRKSGGKEALIEIDIAIAYISLGITNSIQGKNEEAISSFELAIQLLDSHDDKMSLGTAYYNCGTLLLDIGSPLKAQEYFYKAKQCYEENLEPNHPFFGRIYNFIGNTNQELRQIDEAIENYSKALDILISTKGGQELEIASIKTNLAKLYASVKEYDLAEKEFREGIIVKEKVLSEPSISKIHSYNGIGNLWLVMGAKLDSALLYFNKALEEGEQLYGERHFENARTYSNIAEVFIQKKMFDKALFHAQKAHISNSLNFNDTNIENNPSEEDCLDFRIALKIFDVKLRAMSHKWRENALDDELTPLIESLVESIKPFQEQSILKLGEQTLQTGVFNSLYQANAGSAIQINYDLYERAKDPKYIESANNWMERIKALELLVATQKSESSSFGEIPSELLEKERAFIHQIDSIEQLLFLANQKNDSTQVALLQNEILFNKKREYEALIKHLESNYPKYFDLKYSFDFASLQGLQTILDDQSIFLNIFIENSQDSSNAFFVVLTDEEKHIQKASLSQDYEKKIIAFNKLLRSHNLLRADRRRKFIDLSHELYQQFILPIEHLLADKERLIIVGEGITHYLPFETLLKSKEDKPWHELDFLIRDYEVSYHYSGTLFARAQSQEKSFENELLAFAPVFTEEGSSLAALRSGGLVMEDSIFRSVEGDYFSPLPNSEEEVEDISQLFPKSTNLKVLLNEEANEANLKSALADKYRFVHIASHSFANIDSPKFSGIACAQPNSENEKEDGILYVGEIYNQTLNSDLVVLSSCESGVGKLFNGEGMLGLNRSFVYAGVPNVIFSLWKVYDGATGEMMTEFYKNTLNGETYTKALRTAKLKMLDDPEMAAPDIWGAFLLIGR